MPVPASRVGTAPSTWCGPEDSARLAHLHAVGYIGWRANLGDLAHPAEVRPMKLLVNGKEHDVTVADDMPLLWVLRDAQPMRSCVRPVAEVAGRDIATIEGLGQHGDHPVQRAWAEVDVVQCGYCQPGQIMAAVALLKAVPRPTDDDIDAALAGNICRCGTYQRIR